MTTQLSEGICYNVGGRDGADNTIAPSYADRSRATLPTPQSTRESDIAKFMRHVQKTETCWLWTGPRHTDGYGRAFLHELNSENAIRAHRISFHLFVRPLEAREWVLHSCDNPPCVNPAHLRAGNIVDNVGDMVCRGRNWQASVLRCPSGHEYTPENTDVRDGRRYCRRCGHISARRRERERAAGIPPHQKHMTYAVRKSDGVLCEVAVPRRKADALTHRSVGPFGMSRGSRKRVSLEDLDKHYTPRVSNYDQIQVSAPLVTWLCCRRTVYATHPQHGCGVCRGTLKRTGEAPAR